MPQINPQRTLLLRTVARTGSLSAAAAAEGLTVSAVSQNMRALEKEADAALLERHSRGVLLTQAGEIVLAHASEIASSLTSLRNDLRELKEGASGTLRCGLFPTLASSLGPALLKRTASRLSSLQLVLRSARLESLKDLLKNRKLDVALTWDYPWAPQLGEDFDYSPIMRDSTVLVVPGHQADRHWQDFMTPETKWVTRSDKHMIGSVLRKVAAAHRFTPHVVYEANDWAEVQGMVSADVGVALAPALAAVQLREGVSLLPFPTAPVRTIYATRRKRQPPHPGERIFVRELRLARDQLNHLPE